MDNTWDCRCDGDHLGGCDEILGRLHIADSQRHNRSELYRECGVSCACAEKSAALDGLRHLDRHRHHRYQRAGHAFVQGDDQRAAVGLHCDDCYRHNRSAIIVIVIKI